MKCNNCGYENMSSADSFCPRCGAMIDRHYEGAATSETQHATSQVGNSGVYLPYNKDNNRSKKQGSNNNWIIILLALIVAFAVVGVALYFGMAHQDEETMWAQCNLTHEISDYKIYLDTYPNGEHSAEAKKMYNLLINEKTMWEQVQASNDEFQLRSFITNHPGSKFLPTAKEMLDDVVWNNALAKNSSQAVEAYLREFPNGRHIAEARSRYEDYRLSALTVDERNRVKDVVAQFFSSLEQWSLPSMLATCNIDMHGFMGKRPANHADVREFFNTYQESGIDSIAFTSLAVDVSKSLDNNHQPRYQASFTVTRRFWREGEGVNTALMSGTAIVDAFYRFDEFSLDKMSLN